jgi:hypothetical protein
VSHVLGLISWDPEIRNILALALGVGILIGSVILIISTNTGPRTGVLIGLAALFGWMTIMGLMWWMYSGSPASLGGMKGIAPHWRVIDVNVGNLADDPNPDAQKLPTQNEAQVVAAILKAHPELLVKAQSGNPAKVPTIGELVDLDPNLRDEFNLNPGDLNGWHLLVPSDKQRGDAQAVADTALGPDGQKIFTASSDYKVLEAYDIGGKENTYPLPANPSVWDRVWNNIQTIVHFQHPEHFAVVQVQRVIPQETLPGQAPPTPQVDPSQPVISVVMIRSLGDVRFPGFMMFAISGILFAIVCNTLHRREKLQARNRAAAAAT